MSTSALEQRRSRTICSALWAAYGDAVGFTTELADAALVARRTGQTEEVETTLPWDRLVGGRFGAIVNLPAGTYSDDTQLRLATCRSIRQDGFFDVESFAKIELPIWLGYSLGSGLGSKAAATSLINNSATWYSNFFRTGKSNYFSGGGNGAAMRIQPHVWCSRNLSDYRSYLPDVVRNSITTHGHVRGIGGAMIHAAALAFVLKEGRLPERQTWGEFASIVRLLPDIVDADSDLKTFWLPTWQRESELPLRDAAFVVAREWETDCAVLSDLGLDSREDYELAIRSLAGLDHSQRGSGLKAALFSLCAAWAFRSRGPSEMTRAIANLLDSDTDTIGTMAGALVGALPNQSPPSGTIQDVAYISDEAVRMFEISQNKDAGNFPYPDLLRWQAPRTPLDVLGTVGDNFAFHGLGFAEPIGEPLPSRQNDTLYQWFRMGFGQTVLCKRRGSPKAIPQTALPLHLAAGASREKPVAAAIPQQLMRDQDLFEQTGQVVQSVSLPDPPVPFGSLDAATDEAIRSGFNPVVVGKHLLRFAESEDGLELAIGFAAIVVKAKRARQRKGDQGR